MKLKMGAFGAVKRLRMLHLGVELLELHIYFFHLTVF